MEIEKKSDLATVIVARLKEKSSKAGVVASGVTLAMEVGVQALIPVPGIGAIVAAGVMSLLPDSWFN